MAPPDLPEGVRRSFRYEQLTELTLPVATTLLEGGIVGVIAVKIYQVPPLLLAIVTAAPMFGNLSSVVWNRLASARAKVGFTSIVQALTVACVLAIALAPANHWGAALLVLSMVLSRVCMAGVVTVRSVVWSLNHVRAVRGRTTGRLRIITSLVTVLVSSLVGPLLDADADGFRWVYLAGALTGVVGFVFFSRVRVVGEARQRVLERRSRQAPRGERTTCRQSRLPGRYPGRTRGDGLRAGQRVIRELPRVHDQPRLRASPLLIRRARHRATRTTASHCAASRQPYNAATSRPERLAGPVPSQS